MEFDIKAIGLLFVMRSIIGVFIFTLGALGRQGFLGAGLPVFGSLLMIIAAIVWIGRGILNLEEWSWYTTVFLTLIYIFINTVTFVLGDELSILQIGMDSAIVVHMYLRQDMFEMKYMEEFREDNRINALNEENKE